MPRKAPTVIQESRITFGNFERQFAREVKTDIEKVVKAAAIAPIAVGLSGVAVGVGVGALGWFAMRGLQGFALGIPDLLSPVDRFVSKWFYFTNSETGEKEFNLTNWYDYIFNNQEANEARAKSQKTERTTGQYDLDTVFENEDGSVWQAPPLTTPTQEHENTGGKGTADYEEGQGSNWPFTEDWWPF